MVEVVTQWSAFMVSGTGAIATKCETSARPIETLIHAGVIARATTSIKALTGFTGARVAVKHGRRVDLFNLAGSGIEREGSPQA